MHTSQHPYLSRLDHLRFLAAALVVLFHFFHTHVGDLRSGNPLVSLVDEGHTGIALFMVISGFIFTVIAGDREIHYAGFLKNRILRIYPLFVFAVFLQLMVSTYNDQRNYGFLQLLSWLVPFRSETVPLSPYFVQLWTIWVEFQFYLVFPFLLVFTRRWGARYLLGLLGLLLLVRLLVFAASGSVRFLAYETIFGRMDQFIVGMLVGLAWARRERGQGGAAGGLSAAWLLPAGVAVLLGLHAFSRKVGFSELASPVWIVWPVIEAGLWAVFLWVYLRARWPALGGFGAGVDRSLAALGTASFSIYVMHNLVIAAYNARLPLLDLPGPPGLKVVATGLLVVLPAVVVLSAVTYTLIERPFLGMRSGYLRKPA
ncbi:acyltransferase family protein [Ramlibacter sp. MAHUQ-53]|uniref:acyltransferase family protein n=1 Tax=unclassified Ramlibacter TaxID=2617605 RepID=UPI003625C646